MNHGHDDGSTDKGTDTAKAKPYSVVTENSQQTGGSGSAERVDFLDPDRSTLKKATYTTCSPDNADWYFSARKLDLDSDRQVGTAYGGVLNFFGVPIAGAPAFSFPLNSERRSGVLPPLFGYGSNSGFDLTVPYYSTWHRTAI